MATIDRDSMKAEMAGLSLKDMAMRIKDLKNQIEDLAKQKAHLQAQYDFLTIEYVPDQMENIGIDTAKIDGIGRLQLSSDIYCTVPAGNVDALKEWFKERGLGSFINETINSSTLKAYVKGQMQNGKEYPKDLLKITPFSRATVVKT